MLDLSILIGLAPEKPENKRAPQTRGISKFPDKGDFRVTKGGEIHFSPTFRAELQDGEELKYLDFFDGREMNFGGKEVPFMFMAIVPKGSPKASVQGTEGKVAFIAKRFKQIASELYGIDWDILTKVDFEILRDKPLGGNIFFIPRTSKKGLPDYVRRENVQIYPVIPVMEVEIGVVHPGVTTNENVEIKITEE